jgi:hypothetical protein
LDPPSPPCHRNDVLRKGMRHFGYAPPPRPPPPPPAPPAAQETGKEKKKVEEAGHQKKGKRKSGRASVKEQVGKEDSSSSTRRNKWKKRYVPFSLRMWKWAAKQSNVHANIRVGDMYFYGLQGKRCLLVGWVRRTDTIVVCFVCFVCFVCVCFRFSVCVSALVLLICQAFRWT